MSFPKLLLLLSVFLFGIIGGIAYFKSDRPHDSEPRESLITYEVEIDNEILSAVPAHAEPAKVINTAIEKPIVQSSDDKMPKSHQDHPQPVDRIAELFNTTGPKLPIVETITYTSTVPWLKGRPAWLSDYASHYKTSRHFIARSLNGSPDYLKQEIARGDRFNVLKSSVNFEFHLLVDTSSCQLWLYYINLDTDKKGLIKTYSISLGRIDPSKTSGLLTPIGKYRLGDRIVVYKPKVMGTYQGNKTEMMTVFGTRWIPFESEVGQCSAPAKGFGLHGTPWQKNQDGSLREDFSSIGKYESDGCIRLATPDIEELYAIVITRPTTIEIVPRFYESILTNMEPE